MTGFGMLDTEAIARRFIHAWTAHRSAVVVDELAAPGLVVEYSHFQGPVRGVDAFREALARTFAAFPDLVTEADEVIVSGDRATVRWTYRGTHQAGELYGVAPAGTAVEVRGVTVYRIRDGRVVEEVGVADTASLRAQLEAGG